MPRFTDVDVFLAVASTGSFRRAVEQIGVSRSTVSRAIQRLEEHLQSPLFLRDNHTVRLTDAGRVYLNHARSAQHALSEAEQAVASLTDSVQGLLRVSAPPAFGPTTLVPLCRSFLELHPAVTLDLKLSDRLVNPLEDGIDIAIRTGARLQDSDLRSRLLFSSPLVAVATPAIASLVAQQQAVPWCQFSLAPSHDDLPHAVEQRVETDDYLTFVACIHQGLGAGVVSEWMIRASLQRGSLVRILPDWSLPSAKVWAVYPAASVQPAKVRAFIDHLTDISFPNSGH